jgi:hypothetical protein
MADTSLIIGNGNWAVKETSLLGYNIIQSKYVPIEMTVSRATTATRVNSAGLIELVPRNLLPYSNDLTNGIWTKTNTTIALNTIANPLNGLVNGQTFTPNTTNGDHFVFGSGTTIAGQSYVISFFVKENGYTNCRVGNAATGAGVWFNLSNGTIISGTGGTITALSNGWYLASYLLTASGTSVNPLISFAPSTSTNFAGNGISGGYVFGAQLEQGTTATEYFPTTDRFNIPRVDYSTGTASLLVEPARTNWVLRSEEFGNWSTYNAIVSSNHSPSPNGTQTADLVYPSLTGDVSGQVYRNITTGVNLNDIVTVSAFVKSSNKNFAYIAPIQTTSFNPAAWFNLTTGAITNIIPGATASITAFPNGWWRISVTTTATAGSYNAIIGSTDIAGNNTNTASGTNGILVWGAQVEVGSNATSYIPTTTGTVSRAADVISKTGISSLIGQTEGTIFVEANLTANTSDRRIITIGTEFQRIMFWTSGTILYVNFNAVGVNLGNFPIGTAKIALGYTIGASSTTYSIKLNNNTLITGTANAAPSSLSAIYLGSTVSGTLILNDRIESATLFLTRLTDPQLANLTAI